ncbi:MAG: two-component system, sensor histidine kinase RegB [Myxococcales bacterium]|nr:two-component system, sensor histidine kinase RegB [Myxococcales bacterium]
MSDVAVRTRTLAAVPDAEAAKVKSGLVERSATAITLTWLVRLRWGFFLAQAVTVVAARYVLAVDVPIAALAAVVAASGASNLALDLWSRKRRDPQQSVLGAVFVLDTLLLTALLYFSGGPANPFSVFYLVHVTIAAVALGMRWAALVVVLSVLSYATLFFQHVNVPAMEHAHHSGTAFSVHLQGMWFALTIAASLIAYFVTRVSGALRAREVELLRTQRLAARNEKLASLSTLAAGAAHELGTPLGTIAIAAKELERSIHSAPDEAVADARLIRDELERCRAIVSRMSASAGQSIGELPAPTTTTAVLAALRDRMGDAALSGVDVQLEEASFEAPLEGLVQVLSNLVQNALHATPDGGTPVVLVSDLVGSAVRFTVVDRGHGVARADLDRVGEPFFTTKPPGQGMGLGLFLARAFADRYGGQLVFSSEEGKGSRVTLELPVTANLEASAGATS